MLSRFRKHLGGAIIILQGLLPLFKKIVSSDVVYFLIFRCRDDQVVSKVFLGRDGQLKLVAGAGELRADVLRYTAPILSLTFDSQEVFLRDR